MLTLSRGCRGKKGINSIKDFRVPRFKGSRVSRAICFQGYQKSKGIRVSRDRGPPQVNRGFLRFGVSKIQRFQGPRDEGFFLGLQGPGIKGIKGSWVPVGPKV